MDSIFLVRIATLLLFLVALVVWLSNHLKGFKSESDIEVERYRQLIAIPEDILKYKDRFFIAHWPNTDTWRVHVGGAVFYTRDVFKIAHKDLRRLGKMGYEINKEYLYDKTEPLPLDEFEVALSSYFDKYEAWENENQGRSLNLNKKPKAPYDFVRFSVIPKWEHKKV